jgi:hypothetical protein
LKLERLNLPDVAGVRAAVAVLELAFEPVSTTAPSVPGLEVSLGRVCGGRVCGVFLGDSLEVVSFTLEPHELDDANAGRERALEFVARLNDLVSA